MLMVVVAVMLTARVVAMMMEVMMMMVVGECEIEHSLWPYELAAREKTLCCN